MEFPVYLPLGPLRLHPHWVFEVLAYLIAFNIYLRLRVRRGDIIAGSARWTVIAAAAVGGALGSKLLYWLEDPWLTLEQWREPTYLMAGKTIVGGLIGGLVAVEWIKRRIGVTQSTGDLFAVPLALGISIGRVGCFLTGLPDHTYGILTAMPWGVNFGDGIPRHPTQIYEILFLLLLAIFLWRFSQRLHRNGDVFKAFMVAYIGFRFLVEFLKPTVTIAGLSFIQWACAVVLVYYTGDWSRWIASKLGKPKEPVAMVQSLDSIGK